MKRHKVTRLIFDFEKEEKWLNEMSAKGLHFISYYFPQYVFEEGKPGEYIYRTEFLMKHPSSVEGKAYIDFLEETGVECVDTYWRWAYFRKKASDGPFELYTDYDSRIRHYSRVMTAVGMGAMINAAIWVYSACSGAFGRAPLLAIPGAAITVLLTGLSLSYWKRARRLKKEMKLHE